MAKAPTLSTEKLSTEQQAAECCLRFSPPESEGPGLKP